MKKLLIVENEKMIRQGIHAIIERSPVPVEEVLECRNGKEALALLNEADVDVMITDIRMPVMDGIELVRQTRRLPEPPLVMVISGYDDFTYAVDMFREGVRDYLLKPVDRSSLVKVLQRLDEEIETERKNRSSRLAASRHFLKAIMLGNYASETEIREVNEQYHHISLLENYAVMCVPPDFSLPDTLAGEGVMVFDDVNTHTVLLGSENVLLDLTENGLSKYCTGISTAHTSITSLHTAYAEAASARGTAFMLRRSIRYTVADKKYEKQVFNGLIEQIVYLLGNYNILAIKQILSQIVLSAQNERISTSDFSSIVDRLIHSITEVYPGMLSEEEAILYMEIFRFNNVYDYYLSLCNLLEQFTERLKSADESKNKQKIMGAVLYLKENYLKDVDMAVVSNHISMNYTQFSFLFKQYMGCNFLDYLKNLRLEESKRLLRETNLRIRDISVLSGFKNEKHFMKVFKQTFSVSPSEYRRSMNKQSI